MFYILLISLIVIALDQTTKLLVMHYMTLGEKISIIPGFFGFEYLTNDGVAFSFKISDKPWVNLTIQLTIVAIALVFLILEARKIKNFKTRKWLSFALALLIGGAIGNCIDRIFYPTHEVTDFLSFIIYYPMIKGGKLIIDSTPFAIFNIADSAVNVGVFMLLIWLIFMEPKISKKENKDEKKENPDETVDMGAIK